MSGLALKWFRSYLTGRCQQVCIQDKFSNPVSLKYGVPQGSVLGPILFTLYTSPLSNLISRNHISHHLYADDTQVYVSFSLSNAVSSLEKLKTCISQIFGWMTDSKLKLNPTKTEFLLIGSKLQRSKFSDFFPIEILNNLTTPSHSARNLGVCFDSNLNYKDHISQTCKTCFYHIRNLRRIRKFLSLGTAKTVASALINSRLDYCNSLLYGLPSRDLSKLQRVQNSLARVICRASRFSSSKPLLKKLHWLPIVYRIDYKICSLVYNSLSTGQPTYLSELIKLATNGTRQLRSSDTTKFITPKVRTNWGQRAFQVAGPATWNALPPSVKAAKTTDTFKKLLKTHFFGQAFPS